MYLPSTSPRTEPNPRNSPRPIIPLRVVRSRRIVSATRTLSPPSVNSSNAHVAFEKLFTTIFATHVEPSLTNAPTPPHTISQFLYGFFVIFRSTTPGVGPSTGNKDPGLFGFQAAAWCVFLISMGLQVLGQVSLFEGGGGPALFIRNVVGFAMFPIYLDGEG